MEPLLRILHLEDDPLDTDLMLEALRQEGLAVEIDRVDTLDEFRRLLGRDDYAVIFSDYSIPGTDPQQVLALARQLQPEVPFIFVSGNMGEETAVEMLKLGASDYVLKQRLGRLGHALRRARREAEEQGRRRQAEASLRQSEQRLHQAHQRLKENEERFREAFAHAPVGMTINDLDGHFLQVNAAYCRITGYAEEELLQPEFNFQQLTHPEDLGHNLAEWRRLLTGQIPAFFVEKRYRRKDGSTIWVRASVTVRRDGRGEPFEIVGIIEDINDRKGAEEELTTAKEAAERANQAKSQFLANVSHELRTPMTVIMGVLEQLLRGNPSSEQRQLLTMGDGSARRLLGVIDDLLDISRVETGQLRIDPRPFDLRQCVTQAVQIFAAPAREKGLRLDCQVAPELPEQVIGDPDRLGQVLLNLIGNAVKFTPRGEIMLTVAATSQGVAFTISDTGIGIPAAQLDRLFDLFTQGDGSLTRRYGGAGLGLAICRELVALMGGEIEVQSQEGEGSTFVFTLPLRSPAPAAPTASDERPPRILLAEDDPMVRELLQMILHQRGWAVDLAENGRQAVDRWQQGGVDLILMDLQMPEVDGITAVRGIRELEEGRGQRRTPIVALTAHARPQDRQECLEAGMDGFLSKPIRIEELQATVSRHLAATGEPKR